jgi:hypothetical protein
MIVHDRRIKGFLLISGLIGRGWKKSLLGIHEDSCLLLVLRDYTTRSAYNDRY